MTISQTLPHIEGALGTLAQVVPSLIGAWQSRLLAQYLRLYLLNIVVVHRKAMCQHIPHDSVDLPFVQARLTLRVQVIRNHHLHRFDRGSMLCIQPTHR